TGTEVGTATVEFVAGAATGAESTIAADPATGVAADDTETSTLTITARDANDNVVAGEDVFFAITDGSGGTLSAGPWTTDASGVATATLRSTTANTITVTGYLGSDATGTEVGTATVEFVAGAATVAVSDGASNDVWNPLASQTVTVVTTADDVADLALAASP
ncbi:MAG: invasin domain 3-containing protein, partial [Gemmatimonadota bacterium]